MLLRRPGTWVPLDIGRALAVQHKTFERLRPIFDFVPGNQTPPPAPRHASKPKQPKMRTGPKLSTGPRVPPPVDVVHDHRMVMEEDTPDNLTIASASDRMDEDDRYDHQPHSSMGHRKRQKTSTEDVIQQEHAIYADELLDYFLTSRSDETMRAPDPPANFQAGYIVDTQGNALLHWAAAMGDIAVVRQLKRFGPPLNAKNNQGETPLMRAVIFNNCFEKKTFSDILNALFETVNEQDHAGYTVLHHAAFFKDGRQTGQTCSRFYLDTILNKLENTHGAADVQKFMDLQDNLGNTALHLAAQHNRTKCVRSLAGRGASPDIHNLAGVTADDLIVKINAAKKARSAPERSSSPFAPQSERHDQIHDFAQQTLTKLPTSSKSEAASHLHRVASVLFEKCRDLASSYEAELDDKEQALDEVRLRHDKTEQELRALTEDLKAEEALLASTHVAAKLEGDAELAKVHFLDVLSHKNRKLVQVQVDSNPEARQENGQEQDTEEQLALAAELNHMTKELRQLEGQYAEALSVAGSDATVEKYQYLLKLCLGEDKAVNLREEDIDSLIQQLEMDEP